MKNTKEALRYGIETLKVTPDEMFNLIETSKDYDGDDYKRWLAAQIIKLAEEDGVGYSQLLVKRFNIISEMQDNEDAEIKPIIKDILTKESDICIGFSESEDEESIDWYNGLDLDSSNSEFLAEQLPEVYEKLINDEGYKINIVARLSKDSSDKTSELYLEAKSRGILCKNEGALLLYRMCSIADAFIRSDEMSFTFLVDVGFILDKENYPLWRFFLDYFNCEGYTLKAIDLFDGTLGGLDYAIVKCVSRTGDILPQDSIELSEGIVKDEEIVLKKHSLKRYTMSNKSLLNSLQKVNLNGNKELKVLDDKNGNIHEGEEAVKISFDNLGFINLNSTTGAWLSTLPTEKLGKNCIEINQRNLKDAIIYFSVSFALKAFCINEDIRLQVTGSKEYNKLLYNCVPLFLYSYNSLFRSYVLGEELYKSKFGYGSELCNKLLEEGEIYISFEARELINFCKGYSDYLKSELHDDEIYSSCFNDLRKDANLGEFNNEYMSLISNLCGYIKSLYKDMQ